MKKIITNNEKETFKFAEDYAKKLKGGEIIGLIGDLGAGKTVFTKGLAKGLGIKETITSPTFVIMKIYKVKNKKLSSLAKSSANIRVNCLAHIDAYRINTAEDLEAIGALEYFKNKNTVTVIEWPENIKKILPLSVRYINIKYIDFLKRSIS